VPAARAHMKLDSLIPIGPSAHIASTQIGPPLFHPKTLIKHKHRIPVRNWQGPLGPLSLLSNLRVGSYLSWQHVRGFWLVIQIRSPSPVPHFPPCPKPLTAYTLLYQPHHPPFLHLFPQHPSRLLFVYSISLSLVFQILSNRDADEL